MLAPPSLHFHLYSSTQNPAVVFPFSFLKFFWCHFSIPALALLFLLSTKFFGKSCFYSVTGFSSCYPTNLQQWVLCRLFAETAFNIPSTIIPMSPVVSSHLTRLRGWTKAVLDPLPLWPHPWLSPTLPVSGFYLSNTFLSHSLALANVMVFVPVTSKLPSLAQLSLCGTFLYCSHVSVSGRNFNVGMS